MYHEYWDENHNLRWCWKRITVEEAMKREEGELYYFTNDLLVEQERFLSDDPNVVAVVEKLGKKARYENDDDPLVIVDDEEDE